MLCLAAATHNFKLVKIAYELFKLEARHLQMLSLNTHFILNNNDWVEFKIAWRVDDFFRGKKRIYITNYMFFVGDRVVRGKGQPEQK